MLFKSYPYLLCGLFLFNAVPAHAEETQPNNDTKSIQTAADHGDAKAQYHLGMIYLDGQKVKQDSVAARNWITKAAQQGYTDAEAQLGEMNILGQGFANDVENDQKKNYEAAKEWLDKASAKGNAKANYWLGNVHNDTQNAMQSAQETLTNYQDAAKKSYDQAHSKVTDMYDAGSKSVSQDSAKARDWFQQAANQGNMNAQGYMADMYRFGTGGPVDTQKAKSMYEKLCQEGQKKACDSYKDIEEKGK